MLVNSARQLNSIKAALGGRGAADQVMLGSRFFMAPQAIVQKVRFADQNCASYRPVGV